VSLLLLCSSAALLLPASAGLAVCWHTLFGKKLSPPVTPSHTPAGHPATAPSQAGSYNQIMLKSPVLLESELDAVRNDSSLNAQTFSLHYTAGTPHAMADALSELCKQVGRLGQRAGAGWTSASWCVESLASLFDQA